MSSGSYKQVHVSCPFYNRDDGCLRINCEGVVDGSTITTTFHKKQDFEQQMDIFCCEYYKNCEIYRMLMEAKY